MAKILLDYVFPITVITPTPAASTGFLKRVALVCKPKTGQEVNVGQLFACTNMTQVAARTDNQNAEQLFNGGLSHVFILLADDLDLAAYMTTHAGEFYTVIVSDDFDDDDIGGVKASLVHDDLTFTAALVGEGGNDIEIVLADATTAGSETVSVVGTVITIGIQAGVSTATQVKAAIDNSEEALALISVAITGTASSPQTAMVQTPLANGSDPIDVGTFDGVTAISSNDAEFCAAQVALTNRCAFFTSAINGAKNMCFAFGALLSNPSNWLNQQYISMPFNDGVDELGEANALFDDKVSFVIHDDEFGNRLALFAVQGKAIVAPYILKNLRIDLQSRALQWISQNMPQYTLKEASLLETRLQEDVIQSYIDRAWIESGTVIISLVQSNFVANGAISVPQPKALWRVLGQMTETV